MSKYSGIQKEAQLKALVFADYFDGSRLAFEQEVDNIDFIVTNPKTRGDLFADSGSGASAHYLWGEAKKGTHDVYDMFTQLLLTCKKTYDKGDHLAPPYLCCFDEARIAFVPFHVILPVFNVIDINWTQTPSKHDTADFAKAREQVKNIIGTNIDIYNFGADDAEIKEFIQQHIGAEGAADIKSPITKDNFVQIFFKWVNLVKPSIDVSPEEWEEYKKRGILECDFFIADMMSEDGSSLAKIGGLKITLVNEEFKFKSQNEFGRLAFSDIGFRDGGEAHAVFWNRYKRPPINEAQNYIINRRDIFVPGNLRQIKGSYFTPSIWVKKSQEYLAKTFGDDWQEEYYIWDCAAGTGNLLAGLTNPYNVWASDIDDANVERMHALSAIDDELNLLAAHTFQFDFLNDSFDKLPLELKKVIDDPKEREKLIIFINPPYKESTSGIGLGGITGVHQTSLHNKYKAMLGQATKELFAQFFARTFLEIPGCILASFSTLKYVNSSNFRQFREYFKAEYKGGFICPANTFDNVHGEFAIGFLIWNLAEKGEIEQIETDVYNKDGVFLQTKWFYSYKNDQYISAWDKLGKSTGEAEFGYLYTLGTDFQHNQECRICNRKNNSHLTFISITSGNILAVCSYLVVRHCFDTTWLNNRDQFLVPNAEKFEIYNLFQYDCLISAIFHPKNYITCADGTNHWIPFREAEVGAKEKFASHRMTSYFFGKDFSPESLAVLDAGRELWRYYHAKIKNIRTASVNASFYDIRAFFQGRDEKGRMNNASADETYNALMAKLRDAQKALTAKIQPKVYEYGFLKE